MYIHITKEGREVLKWAMKWVGRIALVFIALGVLVVTAKGATPAVVRWWHTVQSEAAISGNVVAVAGAVSKCRRRHGV